MQDRIICAQVPLFNQVKERVLRILDVNEKPHMHQIHKKRKTNHNLRVPKTLVADCDQVILACY